MKAGFDQTERKRERCKAKARRCRIRGWLSSIVFSFHGVLSRFLHPVLLVRTAFPAEMEEEKGFTRARERERGEIRIEIVILFSIAFYPITRVHSINDRVESIVENN